MSITIKTEVLKELVSHAMQGVSNNKLIPVTGLMNLSVKDGKLEITTTDATNYLYVSATVDADDFYVTTYADVFAKLIARMTCENVTLDVTNDSSLEVKGNGTYNIELPLNEEGKLIKYPFPFKYTTKVEEGDIKLSVVKTIINALKPSLAVTAEVPCYMGYYCGDRVIATDTYKIASMDVKLFNEPKLISAEMLELVGSLKDEDIHYEIYDNNEIVFITQNETVRGTTMQGIEDYQVNAITNLVNTEFNSKCELSKDAILQLLDRLSLFVDTYDKNEINLTFTGSELLVQSKKSSGVEAVQYLTSDNAVEFTCTIDIEMLISQIKTHTTSSISIQYGLDNSIKLTEGNITQIIALSESE